MSHKMYFNGETYCCVHDNGDSYFVIYNGKHPYDDEQTRYKTIIKPRHGAAALYLSEFLEQNDYQEIAQEEANT